MSTDKKFPLPHSLEEFTQVDRDARLECSCGAIWFHSDSEGSFCLEEGNGLCELPRFWPLMVEMFETMKKFANAG